MNPKVKSLLHEIGNIDLWTNNLKRIDSEFQAWFKTIRKWNRTINLVSRFSTDLDHHLYDSLQYLRVIPLNGKILDIGSGAGFPGVALKIVHPVLKLVLLDSKKKRVNFLKTLVRELKLDETQVLWGRAEEISLNASYQNSFDLVSLRGVGGSKLCLELGGLFLKTNGVLVIKQKCEEIFNESSPGFKLEKEIPITGFRGSKSKLMVFSKCST